MLQETFTMREGGFTKTDYVVFCVLCLLSCAGGLWYSVTGATTQSVENVKKNLLGNKSLSTVPVALSLIASYISVLTILATPAEVYNYGAQYWLVIVGVALSCFIVCVVYLPVFFTLRLSTSYEYLEVRFNRHVRAVASFLFLFDEIMFLPMVVYIPVLAFNQLTGFNIYAIGTIMVVACGIYTALGGLKAIIWTHTAQTTLMFTGLTIIVIIGTIAVGGVAFIYKTVSVSGRTSLSNWDISPIQRQTGWGAVLGGTIYWTCFNSVNQIMVQRYVALPTKGKAYTAISIFGTGSILTISLCVWCGLTAYGTWVSTGCHPGASPLVDDRLLPAYVTYISTNCGLPGLTGLFVAGIFGAGLSSLSVVLNACALVVIEDMLHGWLQIRLMPLRQAFLARTIIMVLAILSVLMMYVIQKLGGLLGVATAVSAIAASTTCGIFTLGMLCSWVGPRGAVAGAFAGVFVTFSLTVGTQTAGAMGLRALPLGVGAQCPNITSFQNIDGDFDPETILSLFRISYHWVALMGLLTTTIVGAILGKFLDIQDDMKMDAELYSPVVWRFLPVEAHAHSGDTRRARKISLTENQHASPILRDTGEKVAPDESTSNNNK